MWLIGNFVSLMKVFVNKFLFSKHIFFNYITNKFVTIDDKELTEKLTEKILKRLFKKKLN